MSDSNSDAYKAGRSGQYYQPDGFTESQQYQSGRNDRAEERGQRGDSLEAGASAEEVQAYQKGQQTNKADPLKAFGDLLIIVMKQLTEMGVKDWKGYLAGILIFFETIFLFGTLLGIFFKIDILIGLLVMFGGAFLFMLQKFPLVRKYSQYGYPALWFVSLLIGGFSKETLPGSLISVLVYPAISFGIHFLFTLGFKAKPNKAIDTYSATLADSPIKVSPGKQRSGENKVATLLLENNGSQVIDSVEVSTYWKNAAGVVQDKKIHVTRNISLGEKHEVLNALLWKPGGLQKSLTVEYINLRFADGSSTNLPTPPEFTINLLEAIF